MTIFLSSAYFCLTLTHLNTYLTFVEIHDIMSLKSIPLAVGSPSLGDSIEATSYWLRISGQSTLPEGSDIMNNYITWSDFIQFMLMLISGASFLYMVFNNKRK